MSYYVHNVPGRLRIRCHQLKRDTCRAGNLCEMLNKMEGILNTEYNKKAGSLLVHYTPQQLTADDILYMAHKAGCLDRAISSSATRTSPIASTVGAMLGNAIFGTVIKKSVETSMLSLVKAAAVR